MKRLLLSLTLILVLSGCVIVPNKNGDDTNSDVIILQTKISDLENKVSTLESKNAVAVKVQNDNDIENTPVTTVTKDIQLEATTTPEINTLELNQLMVIEDYMEFTVINIYFSDEIKPPTPSSYYSYYKTDGPDTTYLDVVVSYKNLTGTGIFADEFGNVKIIYDEKYNYDGFSVIETENGGDFSYSNITKIDPLRTENIHYLIEVPKEISESNKTINIILTINGVDYYINYR